MKLRARLVWLTLGVSIPGAVASLLLYRGIRRDAERDAIVAAAGSRLSDADAHNCRLIDPVPIARLDLAVVTRGRPDGLVHRHLELWAISERFVTYAPGGPTVDLALRELLTADETVATRMVDDGDGRRLELLLRTPPHMLGCGFVLVRDATAMESRPWVPMPWIALPILLISMIMVGLGPMVARLRRLAAAARTMPEASDVDGLPLEGDDEIADCARAFASASHQLRARAETIAARERTLRCYVDDTNHDIAMPLSVLRGHLTRLLDAARLGRPADLPLVRAAVAEAHYMGAMLHDLATFASLERGVEPADFAMVDMNALVDRAVSRHRTLADEKLVSLERALPEVAIEVRGDATCIEQAVSNLVLNAVRHHPRDGHVAVVLDRTPEGFVVRVDDDGPGIAPNVLAGLMTDALDARVRPRGATGQGLGLRIVARIAKLHRWQFSIEPREPVGTCAKLSGPCDAARST